MSLHSLISVSKLYEHKVTGLNHLEAVIGIEISICSFLETRQMQTLNRYIY